MCIHISFIVLKNIQKRKRYDFPELLESFLHSNIYIYRLGKKMGDERAKTSIYEYKLIYFWVIYIHSARKQISVILNYFTFNLEFYIYL